MESWRIFKHAVGMVFSNPGASIKVTGILSLISFALSVLILGVEFKDQAFVQQAIESGTMPWGRFIGFGLIDFLISVWSVVAWHRYVLLGETPAFLPAFRASEIAVYIGKALFLFLILIPVLFVSSMLTGLIAVMLTAIVVGITTNSVVHIMIFSSVGAIFSYIPTILVGFRLSPLFPAAALGRPMRLDEAWGKLKGKNWMLLALAVISAIALAILMIPSFFLAGDGALGMAYSLVVGWLQITIGASIVTTLYGVSVEGRELIFE